MTVSELFFSMFFQSSFWQNLSKKLKLSVEAEIRYLDLFEYSEFYGVVQFLCFIPKMLFFGRFDPKIQTCFFKVKFKVNKSV